MLLQVGRNLQDKASQISDKVCSCAIHRIPVVYHMYVMSFCSSLCCSVCRMLLFCSVRSSLRSAKAHWCCSEKGLLYHVHCAVGSLCSVGVAWVCDTCIAMPGRRPTSRARRRTMPRAVPPRCALFRVIPHISIVLGCCTSESQ